jgi:hypothetical protein
MLVRISSAPSQFSRISNFRTQENSASTRAAAEMVGGDSARVWDDGVPGDSPQASGARLNRIPK